MFKQKTGTFRGRRALIVSGLGNYSLTDTLECGQCFRHRLVAEEEGYAEYMTVIAGELVFVAQRRAGELIFYDADEEVFERLLVPYFSLTTDYEKIRADVCRHTSSAWLKEAAESAKGIAILKQDEWEALFSFIVSQNNNIPRIKKIIAHICAEYGENLCLQKGFKECPLKLTEAPPCEEFCKRCGACYSFPTARAVAERPEGLLAAKPGFRYKYLTEAARRVASGECDLKMIAAARSSAHVVGELMKLRGVGLKVASCAALFGFGRLDAFPVDVWMKRAIDEYFGGHLDPTELGRYAGVAQQYIFHYVRVSEESKGTADAPKTK